MNIVKYYVKQCKREEKPKVRYLCDAYKEYFYKYASSGDSFDIAHVKAERKTFAIAQLKELNINLEKRTENGVVTLKNVVEAEYIKENQ